MNAGDVFLLPNSMNIKRVNLVLSDPDGEGNVYIVRTEPLEPAMWESWCVLETSDHPALESTSVVIYDAARTMNRQLYSTLKNSDCLKPLEQFADDVLERIYEGAVKAKQKMNRKLYATLISQRKIKET